MNPVVTSILIFVLGFIIGILVVILINFLRVKKSTNMALDILETAKKDADKIKRDSLLETKEEIHKLKLDTDKEIKYRLVIEKSDKTDLDVQYIRYQLQVKEKYYQAKRLDNNIWYQDNISNSLNIKGTNYILLDDVIEPYDTVDIRLMLWTDYETIPNAMQNKYFYGTIKVYSWIEE